MFQIVFLLVIIVLSLLLVDRILNAKYVGKRDGMIAPRYSLGLLVIYCAITADAIHLWPPADAPSINPLAHHFRTCLLTFVLGFLAFFILGIFAGLARLGFNLMREAAPDSVRKYGIKKTAFIALAYSLMPILFLLSIMARDAWLFFAAIVVAPPWVYLIDGIAHTTDEGKKFNQIGSLAWGNWILFMIGALVFAISR